MSNIVLYMITTLDGFIADVHGGNDYEPSEAEHQWANQRFEQAAVVLFGRVTYQQFSEFWDTVDVADPSLRAVEAEFAHIFRSKQRVVVSRTLHTDDPQATVIRHDVVEHVAALKQQTNGDILLICGPELLATLVEHQLVDECFLLLRSGVLGQGKGLFSLITAPINFQRVSTQEFDSGSVMNHYRLI